MEQGDASIICNVPGTDRRPAQGAAQNYAIFNSYANSGLIFARRILRHISFHCFPESAVARPSSKLVPAK